MAMAEIQDEALKISVVNGQTAEKSWSKQLRLWECPSPSISILLPYKKVAQVFVTLSTIQHTEILAKVAQGS